MEINMTDTNNKDRYEILKNSLEGRKKDVLYHDINITNYRLAVAKIDSDHAGNTDLQPFRDHLESLLASSILEKTKEEIMVSVIEQQIKELEP